MVVYPQIQNQYREVKLSQGYKGEEPWSSAVFFNLGSAEPTGSLNIFLGSAKYLKIRVG